MCEIIGKDYAEKIKDYSIAIYKKPPI